MGGQTLVAVRKNLLSWNYTIMDGLSAVAEINLSWWSNKGALTIEGREYPLHREGVVGGDFILEGDEAVAARAAKLSLFSRSFEIVLPDRSYALKRMNLFSRKYLIMFGDREVGSIAPEGIPSFRLKGVFPEELSLPVKVFMFWLVALQRKRAAKRR